MTIPYINHDTLNLIQFFSLLAGLSIFGTHSVSSLINYRFKFFGELNTPYYWFGLGLASYIMLWVIFMSIIVLAILDFQFSGTYLVLTIVVLFLLETVVMYMHLKRIGHLTKNPLFNYSEAVSFSLLWYIALFAAFYLPFRNVSF